MKKTLKTLAAGACAALALVGAIVAAPSVALAAETPSHWAYTAPWATGGSISDGHPAWRDETKAVAPTGSTPIDFNSTQVGGPSETTFDAGLGMACKPGIGCNSTDFYAPGNGRAWYSGSTSVLLLEPQASVAVDLVERFPALDLTGEFYIPGSDEATGVKAFESGGVNQMYGGRPFTIRPDGDGVRFDFDSATPAGTSEGAGSRVVARTTSGAQVNLYVTVSTLNWGGAPTASDLAFATKVGGSVAIPEASLRSAVRWSSAVNPRIVANDLPQSVVPVPGGYVYTPTQVETSGFGFRGEEVQAPAGYIVGAAARVNLTATADEVEPPVVEPPVTEPPVTEPPVTEPPVTEPPVVEPPVTEPVVTAPEVDDYTFPTPLPGGAAAEVDLLSLTHSEGFNPAEWTVEASDAVRWDVRGTMLLLTPEQDGVALSTTWRWRSVIDPSVTSRWATVTAPAATVVPEPRPTPEVTPAPKVTPTPEPTVPPVTPTPPSEGAKAGDEGLSLFGYGAALLLGAAVAYFTRSRRLARR